MSLLRGSSAETRMLTMTDVGSDLHLTQHKRIGRSILFQLWQKPTRCLWNYQTKLREIGGDDQQD